VAGIQITQPVAIVQTPPPPPHYMILACVVLWCINCPFGVAAYIFSSNSQSAYAQGDYQEALKKGQTSRMLSMIGIIITGIVVTVCTIIRVVVMSSYGYY